MRATFFEDPVDQYACVERAWRRQVHDQKEQVIFYRSRPGKWQARPRRWSIKYVLEGECSFEIDGRRCDVYGGFAFVIPAHCPYRSQVHIAKTLSLFGRDLVGADPEPGFNISGVFLLDTRERALLDSCLATIRHKNSTPPDSGPERGVQVNLDQPFPLPRSWVTLRQRMDHWLQPGEGRERAARRLMQARHFITTEFRSGDACSRAAEVASMTRSHFSRQFSALFGQSPRQYLVGYRIAVAQNLLQTGSHSVDAVADLLGYRHASSLSHLFQRQNLSNPRRHLSSH